MTPRDIEAELERTPFVPLRVQLVSGKMVDIPASGVAWLLQSAVLVFQNARPGRARVDGYDVIAVRNIERIEQRPARARGASRGRQ